MKKAKRTKYVDNNSNHLLTELKELFYQLDKKLDLNTQKTEMTLEQVKKINEDQCDKLEEFNKRLKDVENNVVEAKKPIEWLKITMTVLGGISLILGLIYTIVRLIKG